MSAATVLIAGSGIGGLATALALSQAGFNCHVFERRLAFAEAGAGIQIGPNGTRLLRALGAADHLRGQVGSPSAIMVRDGKSGATLSTLPLGGWIETRHGAPYWTAHRADLHAALLAAARARPQIEITCGFDVAHIDQGERTVTVHSADGRSARGSSLIGADGINSAVRRLLFGAIAQLPSGRIAARAVVAVDENEPAAFARNVGVWLAPRAHVVHYPVRAGREIALVVVTQDDAHFDGWDTQITAASVLEQVAGLAPPLLALLHRAREWRQWSLVTTPPLAAWSKGRVVLAGDATGPIMPFLAQGAAMALEDAATLAHAYERHADVPAALAAYETARRPRRQRVATTATRNGQIYHLAGAVAVARNLTLRALPGTNVMAGFDWLYGHQIP